MYAKIIADSLTTSGHRLTTMEVRFHRFVLAEFNTHRAFSRNSASSRAIPVSKQLERVREDLAWPEVWPKEQRGMQGGESVDHAEQVMDHWKSASVHAMRAVEDLREERLHKSVTNRLLEPFMWHTAIVTATDWQGFFDQRCSPLAQPEIRAVAEKMQVEYEHSVPVMVKDRGWHLPYIEREDYRAITENIAVSPDMYKYIVADAKKISAARCARVSYLTQDGVRDIKEDLALYERLVEADPPHWSPLEHVATPWEANVDSNVNLHYYEDNAYQAKRLFRTERPRVGNLVGWRSLRTEFESDPEK